LFDREEQLAAREDLNLLYVAMTRAKQALIVSGCEGRGHGESWYRRIAEAVQSAGGSGLRLPQETATGTQATADASAIDSPAEGALRRPLGIGERTDRLVDPRRRYGTQLHALLERLAPPGEGGDREFLREALGVPEAEFERMWADAQALLGASELNRFFDPAQYLKASNEVAYVSASGELRRIDRLVEFEREIWVLDYKTGESTDGGDLAAAARPYRAQLAEYRAAIRGFFPGKAVHAALLFSGGVIYIDRE
jgi:ATP-dependent helicase/nuclease subunit A